MKFIPNVQGSKELAVPLIVQKTTVYVKTNIHKISTEENMELYEWNEYQYAKDEYIQLMSNEILDLAQKDLDNKLAIVEIYEKTI